MKLIPFKDICEDDEFWAGARFIKKETGLLNVSSDKDFFEYMLINDLTSKDERMICTNIDQHKSGSVISHVRKTLTETQRHTVTAKEFQKSNILEEELHLWFYHYIDDRSWTRSQKNIINQLKEVSFHDLSVSKFMINFDYLFVIFDIEILNEETQKFEFFILKFENIIDFKCDNLCINEESYIELTSFDYQFEDVFEGKMIFLLGESQTSMQIDLKCKAIDFVKK